MDNSTRRGEAAAIGGYLPQYDEFSIRVYDAMSSGELEEIRVADVEDNVGKLDDIVYVTSSSVYAYQVKWTTVNDSMSYQDFKALMPDIVKGWNNLRRLYPDKTIYPKLLTNKTLSSNDKSIKSLVGEKVGGFAEYEKEVLLKIKTKGTIGSQWNKTVEELRTICKLQETEWSLFWSVFSFDFGYKQEYIKVGDANKDQRKQDILCVNRLIQELVARPGTKNPVSYREIITRLGWSSRFDTIFDHNLVVSEESYVPNANGIAKLSSCLQGKTKGYLFLKGSPGSGKSTLLTQWSRELKNPSVRFYAFDFINISSQRNNDSTRGSSLTFLNDIVKQIHKMGVLKEKTLPPQKDFHILKDRFYSQLTAISSDFQKSGIPFLIIVDGLDHITREYKECMTTLMDVLPAPQDIPEGIIFILGSQHFDYLGLNNAIEKESLDTANLVEMPPLSRDETDALCKKLLSSKILCNDSLDKIWTKSQGHPLYLRYLINQVNSFGETILKNVDDTPEGIEDYYVRIIDPLLNNISLKESLGLISRINGTIKLSDIRVLCKSSVLVDIKREMWHLFRYDKAGQELVFFHNSFRQYLLNKTSEDILTGEYDNKKNIKYYERLSEHFKDTWDRGYYLYRAEKYNDFVKDITPDSLFTQAQNYRPIWSIRRDMERGVEIGRMKKDPYLLVRYLFLESQLSQMDNQDYSVFSLVDEFIETDKSDIAKKIIREGRALHCSQAYAMELAVEFLRQGDREEANLLFELSYPEFLTNRTEEHISRSHDIKDKISVLKKWIKTGGYFIDYPTIRKKISLFLDYLRDYAKHNQIEYDAIKTERLFFDSFVESLIDQNRWMDLESIIKFLSSDNTKRLLIFKAYDRAICRLCERTSDENRISRYYHEAENLFEHFKDKSYLNVRMLYLAVKSKQSEDVINKCLSKVNWNDLGSFYQSEVGQSFNTLYAHIFYVRIRSSLGFNDSLLELIPDDDSHQDNALMVNYARRVFTIAKMAGQAQSGYMDPSFLKQVGYCIRSFDSLVSTTMHNRFAYTLLQQRADFYEYIVNCATYFSPHIFDSIAKEFIKYFSEISCKADANAKRVTLLSLFRAGYDKELCEKELDNLDRIMLNGLDVDGRERECLCQGRAWNELGHHDKAGICFHQMLEESFGIGYRKDYQPTLFAEWIGSAITLYPSDASTYIHWLTSRLEYIETVAESRTCLRAAERLLDETLSFNLRSGLKLSIWLLNKEHDYFQSVSSSLIQALLKISHNESEFRTVFRYYTLIHLYTDENDTYNLDSSLLELVIKEGIRILGESIKNYIQELRQKIVIECPESISDKLLESLEIIVSGSKKATERTQRDIDKSLEEACKLSSSGKKDEAWGKCIKQLDDSSSSGWARYYDGGSRINICRTLQQIDENKGRDFALDLFANDIPEGFSYGTIQYLDEILPLLTKTVDSKRLFAEEFAYMNRMLRQDTCIEEDKPDVLPDESLVCEILRDWLYYLAQMPVVCLSERSKMLLAHLYNESDVEIVNIGTDNDIIRDINLEIACYLVELNSPRLSDFIEIAKSSVLSDNFQHRIYARKILEKLGMLMPIAPRKSLPAIYSMVFPNESKKRPSWIPDDKYNTEIDWSDASSIMGVASHWSEYLSLCSGIDKRTIDNRAVELMKKYGDTTLNNDEKNALICRHLDSIGLRYPYRKAHVDAALNAMLAVAAELHDCNAIKGSYCENVFISHDFMNVLIDAQKKPDFIHRIADKASWSVEKDWIGKSNQSPRLLEDLPVYEGKVVIAEYSNIKKMGDNFPVEEFQTKISFNDNRYDNLPANTLFGKTTFMMYSDDYFIQGSDDSELILMRSGYYTDFSNKSHWIAINPAFAYFLNLKPCEDGIFAWQNAFGEKVIESIYWQSGNINCTSRDHYEASEGWIVVAKKELVDEICEENKLYVHKMVLRRDADKLLDYTHKAYHMKPYSSNS